MNSVYLNRTIRFLLVVSSIVISLIGLFYLSKITYPFLIGLAIAFFMNPLVNFFQKKGRMPRALAVVIALVLVFAFFAGLITLLVAEIVSGADYLAQVVPDQLDTLIRYIEHLVASQIIPFTINLQVFLTVWGVDNKILLLIIFKT